jgi:hypothetical protein
MKAELAVWVLAPFLLGLFFEMETCSSETSADFQTTLRYTPGHRSLQTTALRTLNLT